MLALHLLGRQAGPRSRLVYLIIDIAGMRLE